MLSFPFNINEYRIFCYEKLISLYQQSKHSSWFIFNLEMNKCHYISSSIQSITGFRSSEYINKGIDTLFNNVIHPEDYVNIISNFALYIRNKNGNKPKREAEKIKKISFRIKHKNGYWIQVKGNTVKVYRKNNPIPDFLLGFLNIDYNHEDNKSYNPVTITLREREVLQLVGNGYSSKIIADKLNISETTAISHRKNLIQKFQVNNTAELIKEAVKGRYIS